MKTYTIHIHNTQVFYVYNDRYQIQVTLNESSSVFKLRRQDSKHRAALWTKGSDPRTQNR
jgi:hypothetical protein